MAPPVWRPKLMMPEPWGISAGGSSVRLPVVTGGMISPSPTRPRAAQATSQMAAVVWSAARIITMLAMKNARPPAIIRASGMRSVR